MARMVRNVIPCGLVWLMFNDDEQQQGLPTSCVVFDAQAIVRVPCRYAYSRAFSLYYWFPFDRAILRCLDRKAPIVREQAGTIG